MDFCSSSSRIARYFLILSLFVMPTSARAYIDPGTGSILLQGLIAGMAAVAGALGVYWDRVRSLFRFGATNVEKKNAGNEVDKSSPLDK